MTSNWVHSAMVHGIHPPATPLPQGKRLTLTATSRVVASVLVYTAGPSCHSTAASNIITNT